MLTGLKQQKAELHATNLRRDAALTHMSQGLCLYDREGRLQVNRRFCEIFDISPELVRPGMTFEDVFGLSVAAGNHGSRTVADLLAEGEEFLARRRSGNYLQQLSDGRIVSIAHRSTSDGGWLISCEDVTEQQRAQSQIAFMARQQRSTASASRTRVQLLSRAKIFLRLVRAWQLECLDLSAISSVALTVIELAQADALAKTYQAFMGAMAQNPFMQKVWGFAIISQLLVLLWHQVGIPAIVALGVITRYPSSGTTVEWAYPLVGALMGLGPMVLRAGPGADRSPIGSSRILGKEAAN